MFLDYRFDEEELVTEIVKDQDVVVCTLNGITHDGLFKRIGDYHFSVCIIDECSQVMRKILNLF